ncbi:hypothetical protein [Streptomyces sp. NPDC059256]|uniref:hypothetical protein n=1 Tax=Streptomyces sp. NPDC059256 TaxID=3346794 RepID=UPI0036CDD3C2
MRTLPDEPDLRRRLRPLLARHHVIWDEGDDESEQWDEAVCELTAEPEEGESGEGEAAPDDANGWEAWVHSPRRGRGSRQSVRPGAGSSVRRRAGTKCEE